MDLAKTCPVHREKRVTCLCSPAAAHTVVHLPHDAGEKKAEQKTHVPPSRELVRLGGETRDRRLAYGEVKQSQKDGGDQMGESQTTHSIHIVCKHL